MPISTAATIISHILSKKSSRKQQTILLKVLRDISSKLDKTERLLLSKKSKKNISKGEKVLVTWDNLCKVYIKYLKERLKQTKLYSRREDAVKNRKEVANLQDIINFIQAKSKTSFSINKLKKMDKFLYKMIKENQILLDDIKTFNAIQRKTESLIVRLSLGSQALRVIVDKNKEAEPRVKEIIEALRYSSKKVKKYIVKLENK
ncbi:hypothetical protein ACFL1D_01960 [Candidatus Omnitrophota bacterium]